MPMAEAMEHLSKMPATEVFERLLTIIKKKDALLKEIRADFKRIRDERWPRCEEPKPKPYVVCSTLNPKDKETTCDLQQDHLGQHFCFRSRKHWVIRCKDGCNYHTLEGPGFILLKKCFACGHTRMATVEEQKAERFQFHDKERKLAVLQLQNQETIDFQADLFKKLRERSDHCTWYLGLLDKAQQLLEPHKDYDSKRLCAKLQKLLKYAYEHRCIYRKPKCLQ